MNQSFNQLILADLSKNQWKQRVYHYNRSNILSYLTGLVFKKFWRKFHVTTTPIYVTLATYRTVRPGRIWPWIDLVFNRTLLTHKPNWKFIVLLNMMLVRHLGHFIFHKMTWHAAFVASSHWCAHFVLIHKGKINTIKEIQEL